ncbi:hypothetical protein ATANTOWER_004856 [Ataeniobius toweri]|uniref:Uncharacterized protein n=1 Tax=Ataeniobius toweri TaxID=208326 RepID=A0ABU7A5N5_9TELE|nr:hypothetical protein [Ataeniobius toweri]
MSANRVRAPTNRRNKSPGNRTGQHGPSRASKVLAERNQAVVAVGAWVESGQNFLEHPARWTSEQNNPKLREIARNPRAPSQPKII